MASLVLNGDTSGSITLSSPAVAGSTTQTLVAATGTLAPLISGTAQASTSGTSIDFTGIPSWVKRITVMFAGVSTSGTSQPYLQIGDAGGIENSSYVSSVGSISTTINTTGGSDSVTAAFPLYIGALGASTQAISGTVMLTLLGSNTWTLCGTVYASTRTVSVAGYKTLSDTLTQIRITTAGGTDTFDAGSINILYE